MKKLFIGFGFACLAVIYTLIIKLVVFRSSDLEPIKKLLNPIQIPTLLFFVIGMYFLITFVENDAKKNKELQKKFKELRSRKQNTSKE